jgi:hypothetical protein
MRISKRKILKSKSKISKRIFCVSTSVGEVQLKVPGYDKLLPLFSTMQKDTEGQDEVNMMMSLSKKCIPLFWADEREIDVEDVIGSLQDLDLSLKDIIAVASAIFEKIKDQVTSLNEATEESKN